MSNSNRILITAGPSQLKAMLESTAPRNVRLFFPNTNFIIQFENHTAYPNPGHFMLYPGGISKTEILLCYGGVASTSKDGPLAGNHSWTITEGA
ncbi:uncharacterized protein N7529_007790 [Penicillium soppii]|uniref:uncharacterized protein n=1 Tax=Penicillium soppii TaxID=69789 RepID=UPI002546BC93|nr:uncharacterized protein N7529_007790 [Penicillium soppii]KAJ5860480.1 hypothetical protein N7529_007790 [Penicillium soppii]